MQLGKKAGLKPYDLPLRNVFGDALLHVATENPRVVVLDGDLANSTKADTVRKAYPGTLFQYRHSRKQPCWHWRRIGGV